MSQYTNPILTTKEWHEIYLRMVASTSTISLLISMSSFFIYILIGQLPNISILQSFICSVAIVSFVILILQTLRSMYHSYHLPLMQNCKHYYQKIIFICSSISMVLIIITSFVISTTKLLQESWL
ncbi:hypothetical protein RFI36_09205 [Acinetobacter gerneri]|uniref:DUF202 domain-containing protein n=1 Tax=Acinetobacter gerneri TaxID=202952 RepID=A0AAW8JH93_9GAMM|nr:hypothetical protein [Acinetobacter gerneri]MDQ9010025.1 hypothetical protein [Acinetobacter gerneri]MDQ9014053.1 hypothetical protein [Acinetobacter gerneri]MDQ9025333.1 hypothetical protein [Acinetobacter gerneri]MDQ9052612.1 hypothetical protein [Acinetobacter gerneri]MDQ9060095.1 hypothetical protein [Acinetobacter gerneri]